MLCEQPTCTREAIRICDRHCHLSLCRQHCLEHENNFLRQFKDQLDQLGQPVSRLLKRTRTALESSEEARQAELKRMNQIFDQYLSVITQRSQLSKIAQDFVSKKREVVLKCKDGDRQLTREEHQQLQAMYKNIQESLQDQYDLTQLLTNKDRRIDPSSTVQFNMSVDAECIDLSDAEENQSRAAMECSNADGHEMQISPVKEVPMIKVTTVEVEFRADSPVSLSTLQKLGVPWNSSFLSRYRDSCPFTKLGVFGLKKSHNLARFCPEVNPERCLYGHFAQTHRIKSTIACQLVKAVATGADPMTTIILPDDDSFLVKDNIPCPLNNKTLQRFDFEFDIPNAPCRTMLSDLNFKYHLMHVHEVTKANATMMHRAIKTVGTIDHIEWSFE